MLNFRNTSIFILLFLVIAVILNIFFQLPIYIDLLILLVYSFILFYGSYFIQSNFYIKAICSSNSNKKEIALTFDDGPAQDYTTEILSILKAHQTQAAFFCIGNRITGNESILKKMHEEGHIIGNHSNSHHFWFDLFSKNKMWEDLNAMSETAKAIIGQNPKLFRPPYGVTNPNLKNAVTKGKFLTIGWNIRSMDTVIKDEEKLMNKIKNAIKPGAILLLHDTSKTTVNILPALIIYLKESGYEIKRLDKMLGIEPYF